MCSMCENVEGDMFAYCQDCGQPICFDGKANGGAFPRMAYVTESGDLFCYIHGRRHDAEAQRLADEEAEEWGWMPGPWDL